MYYNYEVILRAYSNQKDKSIHKIMNFKLNCVMQSTKIRGMKYPAFTENKSNLPYLKIQNIISLLLYLYWYHSM